MLEGDGSRKENEPVVYDRFFKFCWSVFDHVYVGHASASPPFGYAFMIGKAWRWFRQTFSCEECRDWRVLYSCNGMLAHAEDAFI